jgi:hypothetical protein
MRQPPTVHRSQASRLGLPRKIREIYAQGGVIISLVAEAIARQATVSARR